MREELIKTLLNEYKETEKALELGMDLLSEKDYAKGKLDLVKVIIGLYQKNLILAHKKGSSNSSFPLRIYK